MALRIVGWRVLFLADLWVAGEAGLPAIYHEHLMDFVDNQLAETFEDPTCVLTERVRLTAIGLKYARWFFEED
jgi:hypothetical protein